MYVLIDIKRHEHLNVRQLVTALEQSVVKPLQTTGLKVIPNLMHLVCILMAKKSVH